MGFTDVGLLRISESVRTYAYLILSSQASDRNVFCSLGYFKTWLLRRSLYRQTSQQTSLDGLRYSLAGEMAFI